MAPPRIPEHLKKLRYSLSTTREIYEAVCAMTPRGTFAAGFEDLWRHWVSTKNCKKPNKTA
jgi:hypothetical protein